MCKCMKKLSISYLQLSSIQIFLILSENVSLLFDTIMFSGVVQTMSVYLIYADSSRIPFLYSQEEET